MKFERKDYASNPHEGANRNNAAARGWGPGWPANNAHKMGRVDAAGIVLWVRKEMVPLVETLLQVTIARGYDLKHVKDDWGYANRPIRGTRTPSNHSWGLAIDLNSTENPMASRFVSDIPPAVVKDWEACGFYWGGRYERTPDTMHFEYLGRPRDVAGHLAKAKAILKDLTEPKGKTDKPVVPATKPKVTDHKPGSRALKVGVRGPDVAYLQRWLGIEDDGIFGPKTREAVKRYQRMQDLPVVGQVGESTWSRILGKKVDL